MDDTNEALPNLHRKSRGKITVDDGNDPILHLHLRVIHCDGYKYKCSPTYTQARRRHTVYDRNKPLPYLGRGRHTMDDANEPLPPPPKGSNIVYDSN